MQRKARWVTCNTTGLSPLSCPEDKETSNLMPIGGMCSLLSFGHKVRPVVYKKVKGAYCGSIKATTVLTSAQQ